MPKTYDELKPIATKRPSLQDEERMNNNYDGLKPIEGIEWVRTHLP
jgi:hypothetical protein